MNAVLETLIEAFILVFIVVLIFLQDWRATLLPMIDVPVSLIGTLGVMAALGFSLNNLSLFGLVLAIGIVVDDAIVVVENIERWMAKGLEPREATLKAMAEITGPVIAITLVLSSVFIPTAFLTGISGQFYRQFALTIAASTIISAMNALTMAPARAVQLIRPPSEHGAARTRGTASPGHCPDLSGSWPTASSPRPGAAASACRVRRRGAHAAVGQAASVLAIWALRGAMLPGWRRRGLVAQPTGQPAAGRVLQGLQLVLRACDRCLWADGGAGAPAQRRRPGDLRRLDRPHLFGVHDGADGLHPSAGQRVPDRRCAAAVRRLLRAHRCGGPAGLRHHSGSAWCGHTRWGLLASQGRHERIAPMPEQSLRR